MDDYKALYKVLEEIIDKRIEKIIEEGNFDEDVIYKIKNINKNISTSNVKLNKYTKKNKSKNKDDIILTPKSAFIKDIYRMIKKEKHLNFLSNDIMEEIESYESKKLKSTERFKLYNNLWKKINFEDNNEIVKKYNNICKNKNLTNHKYTIIVNSD